MSDTPIYDELVLRTALESDDYHQNHGPQSSCIECEEIGL